jgi:hypothetical protein
MNLLNRIGHIFFGVPSVATQFFCGEQLKRLRLRLSSLEFRKLTLFDIVFLERAMMKRGRFDPPQKLPMPIDSYQLFCL